MSNSRADGPRGGDHRLIEGRAIGAGDTACTLNQMTVQGTAHSKDFCGTLVETEPA